MEERKVTVSRLGHSYEYPADCMFVAAMNPCRCGYYPDRERCRCTVGEVRRYLSKISEPLLDRLDICVEMRTGRSPESGGGETSAQVRARVAHTVAIQRERYRGESFSHNSRLTGRAVKKYCVLGKAEREYLEEFFRAEHISMRGYSRILKVARTIADMEESDRIRESHITEAVCLRSINRRYWG